MILLIFLIFVALLILLMYFRYEQMDSMVLRFILADENPFYTDFLQKNEIIRRVFYRYQPLYCDDIVSGNNNRGLFSLLLQRIYFAFKIF